MTVIYLDYQATTPVDPRVLKAMLPYFTEHFGNAASRQHAFGWTAEAAVEQAREQLATLIGAKPREIIFTSGGTEANNLALFGVAQSYQSKGRHLISVVTEHTSVLGPLQALEQAGFRVTYLPVDSLGRLDLSKLEAAITDETILISVMAANNEVGTITPLAEIGTIAKQRGVLFHTDAAQAVGKEPIDVGPLGIGLLSLSAHKFYGPKGVGALYIRSRDPQVNVTPQIYGGGHERGLRSGTLPVPLIVGLGEAAMLCQQEMAAETVRMRALGKRLYAGLEENLAEVRLNGDSERRLPNNLNLCFPGVEAQALLMSLDTVALSTGSACTTGSPEPSHVLRAIGLTRDAAQSSLRFSWGRFTSEAEIDTVIERVVTAVRQLKA